MVKTIYHVTDKYTGRTGTCKVKIPETGHFEVQTATAKWLVLDFTRTELSAKWINRLMEDPGLSKRGYYLAIERGSGEVRIACVVKGDVHALRLYGLYSNPKVPKEFLPRLDSLLKKDTPFSLVLPPDVLLDYISREVGFVHLRNNLMVQLHFPEDTLEIWSDRYRTLSSWSWLG